MAWGRPFPKGVLSTLTPIKKGQRLSPATEFKKGSVPANKLGVGAATIRQHRGDGPRAWVKTAEPNTWVPRAMLVWCKANGKRRVPKGFVVHHSNGKTLDDRPDNLELKTKAEHRLLHAREIAAGQRQVKARQFVDNRIPLKNVTCTECGNGFKAKYQKKKTVCDTCRAKRRAAIARAYRERLRAGT